MSLRELPTEQVTAGDSRWNRLRLVPLGILVVLGLILTVVGSVVDRRDAATAAANAVPAPVDGPSIDAEEARALPTSCSPPVSLPEPQPWLTGRAVEAEAAWQTHASELSEAIVTGQSGYVDWGDVQAQNFSQTVGRRVLTTEEAGRWHDYFATVRDSLAEQGIPLYIAVTPSKFDVYPQFLPEWAEELRGSGPLDQLIAGYPDLPIIDLRQPLRDASTDEPVYSRVNSHWTDYGSYIGWQSIAECIAATDETLRSATSPAISGVDTLGGFNEFETYGVVNPEPDWTVPVYSAALSPVRISRADGSTETVDGSVRTGLEMLPAETATESALSDLSALVVRDSFGSSMSVPLQQTFAQTWQVRHNIDFGPGQQPDIEALATEHRPNVVIFQIAQRHLNFPPTF